MAVELKITIDDAGQLNVNGPIANKMMCYGMLEVAKDAIRETHERNQRLVQPASGPLPPMPSMTPGA